MFRTSDSCCDSGPIPIELSELRKEVSVAVRVISRHEGRRHGGGSLLEMQHARGRGVEVEVALVAKGLVLRMLNDSEHNCLWVKTSFFDDDMLIEIQG